MHRIDRNAVAVPSCLMEPTGRFDDLRGSEKDEIRLALLSVQGGRCAYCERRTGSDRDDGHIEHFRNQAEYADLVCAWTNLFWSCKDEKTCGKHKDKCVRQAGRLRRFDRDDIIDPGNEDPEALLLFVSDGTVRPRDGLSDEERHRAEETLRIFQLADSAYLRKSREDAVDPYISTVEMLMNTNPEYVPLYVERELSKLATKPFATAIKSFLESVI